MKMKIILFVSLFVCANVGMAQQFFIQEDFSTATSLTSPNWSSVLLSGNDNGGIGAWRFDNLGNRAISLPFVPPFAMSDADLAGPGFMSVSALVSRPFDFSASSSVILDFDYMFRQLGASTATVEVFDGTTWNIVSSLAQNDVGLGTNSHESFDLTALAGGAANGEIRFVHSASWDWWYAVDNIILSDQATICDLSIEIISPVTDDLGCKPRFANDPSFTLKVTNTGFCAYASGTVLTFDIKVGDPPMPQCSESLTLMTALNPNGSVTYTTNCKLTIPPNSATTITACITTPAPDNDPTNDSHRIVYENPPFPPKPFGYVENFDGLGTNAGSFTMIVFDVPPGWENALDDGASLAMNMAPNWGPNNGTTGSNQGPPADHTTGTSAGRYMYIEDSPSQVGDIELRGPCLDLNGATGTPTVQFYHFSHATAGSSNDNILEIDILNETTGGVLTQSVASLPGYGDNQWHQVQIDLSAFAPDIVRVHFRTNNQNGNFTDDVAIDDFLFFDAIAAIGQAPQPGNAVFDINNAVNNLGQNVASGANGPFAANITAGGNMNMTWSGQNNALMLCLFGPGNDNIANFGPAIGQLDIGTLPLVGGIPSLLFVFGDGNLALTSLFHAFFFTGPAGTGGINFQVSPAFAPGPLTRFQCVMNPAGQFFISNAVDVAVL